ncbi:CU044_5270 family protein [Actinoplanes sp. TFC3]|uniref:CU044_5270 family protein n=1 Tax=Actinoplanes sp. TFC3 TaxID=1710355 RepID=UPI00083230DF|nr:CU044_5270 family protein [Actinoplanes sp. TFC3]
MNEDLQLVRELLEAPLPTPQVTFQARNRLTTAMERRSKRRTIRAAVAGGIVTVTAAVLAFAVGQPDTTPRNTQVEAVTPAKQPGAHDFLLAAATTAGAEKTGRYWHTETVVLRGPVRVQGYDLASRAVIEYWLAKDPQDASWVGQRDLGYRPFSPDDTAKWAAAGKPTTWTVTTDNAAGHRTLRAAPGSATLETMSASMFLQSLGGFDAIEVNALPTSPAQLRKLFQDRIVERATAALPGTAAGDANLFRAMTDLLVQVPAVPAVRAAAFEVIADLPGITIQEHVKDAEGRDGVRITLLQNGSSVSQVNSIVLDSATHRVFARGYDAKAADSGDAVKSGNETFLTIGWTDAKPSAPTRS